MHFNVLAFAIPLFVCLMLIEFLIARKKGLEYFGLHNSIANVSIGVAERMCEVLVAGVFYFVYDRLQKNYGVFDIKPGVFLWILLFLITDFVWYWYHRLAHEVNLLWMVHVVHHQSEDFNYTVSARITVFQSVVRTGFLGSASIVRLSRLYDHYHVADSRTIPIFYTYAVDRQAGCAGIFSCYAIASPRASCQQSRLPGQKLWRRADNLG